MDDSQLAERMKGLGGSDAAAALGLDPYRTPRELYAVKTGELVEDHAGNRFTRAGAALEEAIARLAAEEYGFALRKKHIPVVHPQVPCMRGNLDRVIVGQRIIVEIKNVDGFVHRTSGEWGEAESDEVPLRYLLQCAHYLACTGFELAYLIALVGGNNLIRYQIHRDTDLEARLIDGECAFWDHVVERTPPALDYTHPSAFALMRRLYPGSDGRMIEMPADANDWHAAIVEAREQEKAAKAKQDEMKARMLEAMAGAAIGRLQCGGEYRYSKILRKAYEVAESEYTTLRYSQKQTRSVSKEAA